MYSEILRSIAGIGVFPVISLLLFVGMFAAVLIWVWRADRTRLDEMAHIPLDASDQSASETGSPRR